MSDLIEMKCIGDPVRGSGYISAWAWLPTIVSWRNRPTLIWMQEYLIATGGSGFQSLDGTSPSKGEKHCNRIGVFSVRL